MNKRLELKIGQPNSSKVHYIHERIHERIKRIKSNSSKSSLCLINEKCINESLISRKKKQKKTNSSNFKILSSLNKLQKDDNR